MSKMTRGEQAIIYLQPAFGTKDFSFQEAQTCLDKTDFAKGGKFTKQSWNSLIKKGFLIKSENDMVHFGDEEVESLIMTSWIKENRKHFICEQHPEKTGIGDFWTNADLPDINEDYFKWKESGDRARFRGVRRPNLPETISEGLPSALFGWARTNNLPLVNIEGSADLVDPITGEAIQVKGISVYSPEDNGGPTSFGPKTEFDRLIIAVVRLDEDKIYFYELNVQEYKNWKVNDHMTLKEQQDKGLRPRLHLLPIIRKEERVPFANYDFNTSMVEYI